MSTNVSLIIAYVTQIKSRITINVGISFKIQKNIMCANIMCGKYLGSIIDDSGVICHEIRNTTKTVSTKTIPAKSTSTNCYILLTIS